MDLEHVENRSFLWILPLNFSFVPSRSHLNQRLHSLYRVLSWKLNKFSKDIEELDLGFEGSEARCSVKRSYFVGVSLNFRVDPVMSSTFTKPK